MFKEGRRLIQVFAVIYFYADRSMRTNKITFTALGTELRIPNRYLIGKEFMKDQEAYTLQVAVEDCTGCKLCTEVCPIESKTVAGHKAIDMVDVLPLKEQEKQNWDFFLSLPDIDRTRVNKNTVKGSQMLEPLFEFSGACSGCGETPYLKLLTQLFGDRMIVANATGCSSPYS